MKINTSKFIPVLVGIALVACAGVCRGAAAPLGGSSEAWQAISNGAPVRVAVFVDRGARNQGVFMHLQLATYANGVESFPVDGRMIRAGALDRADLLVMPGGSSVVESKSLGREGAQKLRDFIHRGGAYIGTCAGCVLLSEPTKSHPNMLGVMPFKSILSRERANLSIAFNDEAKRRLGINGKSDCIRYSHGPVFVPAKPVPDADFTVVGTYNSNMDLHAKGPRTSMAGKAAVFVGTYGKGRVFVCSVHPEYADSTHHYLAAAFKYVTGGRQLVWNVPYRKQGQLVVGIQSDSAFGVATAQFIQDQLRAHEFDIYGINADSIGDGMLRRLDALLVPDTCALNEKGGCLSPVQKGRVKEFLDRGGRIVVWGAAADHCRKLGKTVQVVPDASAAVAALRALAAEPLPPAPKVEIKRNPNPVRAAIYTDTAGSNYLLAGPLLLSPDYELSFLTGREIAEGGLAGKDLLIQPGGGCHRQYLTLGEKGAAAITNFVYGGGKYYGVCAGAFMASQQIGADRPRLGLVPWRNDADEPYRGTAEMPLAITPEGRQVFGPAKERIVQFYGGPVLIPGTPVPDSDIQVLATYDAYTICTFSSKNPLPMRGKAAFVGGRVGKGKVFVSCPHPEFHEYSFDLALSGLGYLTGRKPELVKFDRIRGALEVGCKFHITSADETRFYFDLMTDRRFHVVGGAGKGLNRLDAFVALHPEQGDIGAPTVKFAKQGGLVVVVAETEAQRAIAKKVPGAKVVASFGEVVPLLAARRAQNNVKNSNKEK